MKAGLLSQAEADRLLEMIKSAVIRSVRFPTGGKREEFDVIGDSAKDVFVVLLYRGRIKAIKYNLGARVKKNNVLFLELHIGESLVYTNPDGEEIKGSHWHIYTEAYDRSFAFPAEDIESDRFVENTLDFFEKFNIIDPPEVIYQNQLIL